MRDATEGDFAELTDEMYEDYVVQAAAEADRLPRPIPIPFPLVKTASGLYTRSLLIPTPLPHPLPTPIPIPFPVPPLPVPPFPLQPIPGAATDASEDLSNVAPRIFFAREELRIDVDGRYPQMIVSGTVFSGLTERIHWIANVIKTAANKYEGTISYKNGTASAMPYSQIVVEVTTSLFAAHRSAKVTYSGVGLANSTRTYKFASSYFHPVEFEFDSATGVTAQTSINTCDHPNRPSSLGCETLSIEKVFQRAGFDVKKSAGDNIVPLAGAAGGANANWSDSEMHDAMQVYWSRFANKAQWSMWTFFAALHETGSNLGGIMFDDIGPNHRQGTAVFNNSFIANAPAGDSNPAAWVKRMKFWTACHEMGHAFNLAHSWQKQHPPEWGTPWIPLANEPEARSFMNYPYYVAGGQTQFFADFMFRFSDNELRFMRHAPARFVQHGNADWFDNHGFEQAAVSPEPTFKLEVRANREKPIFEFLEPVVLELKLTNVSSQPQIVEETLLTAADELTVIIKKQGQRARQWAPFAHYCFKPSKTVLNANDSIYESLFLAVGQNGWDLAEPGNYLIQVSLSRDSEDIVSNAFQLRIAPPKNYDEEYFAQDFFSEEVGRILSFDGSQALAAGNETLREATTRFADKRVAIHAAVALGKPLTRDFKLLSVPQDNAEMKSAEAAQGKITVKKAAPAAATRELTTALFDDSNQAAETLSHIDYKYYVDQFANFAEAEGDLKTAVKSQETLQKTLSARGVIKRVLNEIEDFRKDLAANKPKSAAK